MSMTSLHRRAGNTARLFALAALLAASVPAGFTAGLDGAAYAQSSGGSGGGGGGGSSGDGSGGGPNPALECIGAKCIDLTRVRGNCTAGANCEPPPVEKRVDERDCRIEPLKNVRICDRTGM